MVWTHGNEKLESFIAYLNSIHPTIKFTSERSTTSIPFLDVKILLEKGKIQTDLYCKPTDKHQYLLVHSSSHPYHTKKINPLQPCSPFTTYLFKRWLLRHQINWTRTLLNETRVQKQFREKPDLPSEINPQKRYLKRKQSWNQETWQSTVHHHL